MSELLASLLRLCFQLDIEAENIFGRFQLLFHPPELLRTPINLCSPKPANAGALLHEFSTVSTVRTSEGSV